VNIYGLAKLSGCPFNIRITILSEFGLKAAFVLGEKHFELATESQIKATGSAGMAQNTNARQQCELLLFPGMMLLLWMWMLLV